MMYLVGFIIVQIEILALLYLVRDNEDRRRDADEILQNELANLRAHRDHEYEVTH